ncbi:hypothetical protein [Helicobacter bilis]|uniref:Uncharacterized protein n=1 Tax=Helicobacter bilis TaxID=37372 RepID=A0A4U8U7Q8_9HELI|nr:hypothetical protein [Helicobacter bilis]MCI7411025.1 hypothetical protein [Helicobacter bilis]MDD7297727.1 hypothetical protein [Helicobacter bilis]MDY4400841.1 hypothetical protein [Helicobacter bilis]TLE07698.1 hypothetical protein LS78_007990 [Helicobacter bilis]TLE09388.1 hypothetical protein LS79_008025 [Helicobacter bilis]
MTRFVSIVNEKVLQNKGAEALVKHGIRIVDVNKSYECEYEIWNYGGVEVKYYKSIKEVGTNKVVGISQTEPIAQTFQCFKWEVRGEAKARIRFRARRCRVSYTAKIFNIEELKTPCVPHIEGGNVRHVYRYFDRNTRFAYITYGFTYAVSDTPNRDFTEVTIYHKESNKGENITTYFGISPFLNAKRNVSMF